jgi:hypothetical protein
VDPARDEPDDVLEDLVQFLADRGYVLSRVDRRGVHPIDPHRLAELPEETNVVAAPPRVERA